jgi:signal transduction histidine kinase
MGGNISCESEVGHGTEFIITLNTKCKNIKKAILGAD